MARTCAALRANILCFIQPVADATGSKYAGLRPEMDQPIKVSGRNDFTPVASKVSAIGLAPLQHLKTRSAPVARPAMLIFFNR